MDIFKVNQKLKVQPLSTSLRMTRKQIYTTYITEIGRETLTIAVPISRGRFVFFPMGQRLKIWLPGSFALYTFTSMVVGKIRYPSLQLVIKYPTEVIRCQRRRYVRLEILIPATVELPGSPGDCPRGYVVDLSAGGAKLVMNKGCNPGTEIKLTLLKAPYLKTEGRVLRSAPVEGNRGRWEWAVEFIGISDRERDNIVKFIFTKQRELRRRELL
jgi:c-di-GMP-binding flagellar brake protein YcgR